jgi:peptidoglycan/xylan/chitin deacetylase (PgdA/CDA1 family)
VGVPPQFFAYPYGLWNDRVRQAVRAAGYRAAFTLDRANGRADAWSLPRVNIPAGIDDAAFQAWSAGLQLRRAG